jgi:hypothetical protein
LKNVIIPIALENFERVITFAVYPKESTFFWNVLSVAVLVESLVAAQEQGI